jgi:hypothetical protein
VRQHLAAGPQIAPGATDAGEHYQDPEDLVFAGPGGNRWARRGARPPLSTHNYRRAYKAAVVSNVKAPDGTVSEQPRFPHLDLRGQHDLRHILSALCACRDSSGERTITAHSASSSWLLFNHKRTSVRALALDPDEMQHKHHRTRRVRKEAAPSPPGLRTPASPHGSLMR